MFSKDKLFTIYAIRCKSNSKVYIGRTSVLDERIKTHFMSLKSGKHTNKLLLNDYKKYGRDDFEIYILEENIPYKDRNKEYEYMRQYNSFDEKYGYNKGDIKKKKVSTITYIKELPFNLYNQSNKIGG